ncbi:hypothetical protein Q428_12855 [Fervidicella metallireducens AeB]|uniref:DUF3298 domain-containing protein n=1 Tax=Fervidicella metallireducens AeB TaxID=1403537 RepID=A0A017RUH0_9CLOT|nr:DUF3298 and DUF4163 domain-containing protein [Fervidicella metallireducens]EYE87525.1 hypothetical protein Q428_12855 [Fervidicella metallireducens AeB]
MERKTYSIIAVLLTFVLLLGNVVMAATSNVKTMTSAKVSTKTIKYSNKYVEANLKIPVVSGFKNKTIEKNINNAFEKFDYKEIEEMAKDAETDGIEVNDVFPYEIRQSYKVGYNKNGLLSIEMNNYIYTGGAHPMLYNTCYNYDLKTGKRLKLKDLFKNTGYKKVVSNELIKQIKKENPYITKQECYDVYNITGNEAFYITSDSIVICYRPYQISGYGSAAPEFKVPLRLLKKYLKVKI